MCVDWRKVPRLNLNQGATSDRACTNNIAKLSAAIDGGDVNEALVALGLLAGWAGPVDPVVPCHPAGAHPIPPE